MQITMEQVKELNDRYDRCGLGGSSSGRFLRSIVDEGRMPRGRGITWLEELITKGDPDSVAPLIAEIEDLMLRSGRDDTVAILGDILAKVKAGWTLSDHKKSELDRLRKQVNAAFQDLELDERSRLLLIGLGERKRYSSHSYWLARPVISSRLDSIFRRWGNHGKISPDDWKFVRENFKGPVSEFEGGRHPVGALRWTRQGIPVTIMGEPTFDERGNMAIEVLYPNGTLKIGMLNLMMRAPK